MHIPANPGPTVMPCEIIKVSLKPVNFFDKNPALDVPPSTQEFNKSTLLSETHRQPVVEGVVGSDGAPTKAACCAAGPATSSKL